MTGEVEATDRELLERWGQGDRAAGSALFERHFDALYRFFCNKVQDGVHDLMQQTLLGCVEGRERFRGDASFRTYMFQTARRQLYAHYTRNSRSPIDFEITGVADLGTSPSGMFGRKEEERILLEAVRGLPLQHQIVLELTLWEELSSVEIGEILEIPDSTVRSRLRLAMDRLRDGVQTLSTDGCGGPLKDTPDDLRAWAKRLRKALGREG